FSDGVRQALLAGCREAGVPARDGGCYGHVDGPRFNTRAEIRSLALAGVTAVSQTAGPETALAGEAELPYALLGYATDYANGVKEEATPVEELLRLLQRSGGGAGSGRSGGALRRAGEGTPPRYRGAAMAGELNTATRELGESRVHVDVEVAPEAIERELSTAARSIARELKIPGFRKGKVPAEVV